MNGKAMERCRELIKNHIINQYSNIDYRRMPKCDFQAEVMSILHKLWEKGIVQQYGMTLNINFFYIVCNALRRSKGGAMTRFELLVLEMRKKQREYYRTKAQGVLLECKKLEKQVDDHLAICDQPELFGGKK